MKKIVLLAALLLLMTAPGCSRNEGPSNTEALITPPVRMEDGWTTGSLRKAGIDSLRLLNLLRRISENEYPGMDGVLIVKDGRLVFEQYFAGHDFEYAARNFRGKRIRYGPHAVHNLASVTKSVTGLLAGIALDRGCIRSVDQRVADFFPGDSVAFSGDKGKITLFHLLTMSSGLQWNEQDVSYGDRTNDIVRLFIVEDPLRYILSKPLAAGPGTKWYYNGGGTNLIGQIVQRTSGMRLDAFARKHLFGPLGIERAEWVSINQDFVYASGDLRLTPRDMAKLGLLVLDRGVWNGRPVVSSGWIGQMTKKQVSFPNGDGYGFQWWIRPYRQGSRVIDSIHASGWGGQAIIVLPSLKSIVVVTGSNYASKDPTGDMMFNYLLPSLDGEFKVEDAAIAKEAPIPGGIRIVEPVKREGPAIAGLSGHWLGRWDGNFLSCQLAVERIEGHAADIVYSWAAHPSGYFRSGWVRKKVPVDSTGALRFVTSDSLDFRLDPGEDVLVGNLKNAYVTSKAILRRRK